MLRGDIGSDMVTHSGNGSQFVWLHVDEGSKESTAVRIEAELEPKGIGGKIVLRDFGGKNCSATPLAEGTESAAHSWPDMADHEDALDILVEVTAPCVDWTLTIHR